MQKSSLGSSSRGGSRVGSAMYSHSPYTYRRNLDDAPVSPTSDQGGRQELSSPSAHLSTGFLSKTKWTQEMPMCTTLTEAAGPQLSQPSSPLSLSTGAQEYSPAIQVSSPPNVHPRYRRSLQSPMTHCGSHDSGSRSYFPSSPLSGLHTKSPCMQRDEGLTGASGSDSVPVRGHSNNPYKMSPNGSYCTPQYGMSLADGHRYAGNESDGVVPSPSSHYAAHEGPLPPPISAIPAYGGRTPNHHQSPLTTNDPTASSYAPAGFSMPPTITPAMNSGGSRSYRGSAGGRGGSQSFSYTDLRSSHAFSPVAGGVNGAQPPPSMFTVPMQQMPQRSSSFPTNTYHSRVASGSNLGSSLLSGINVGGGSAGATHCADCQPRSESHETKMKPPGAMADETLSCSGNSSSSASSIRDDLPLCPDDDACTLINDRKHQKKYAHTCRLFPCYHGHVTRHAKLFRHTSGQVALPEGVSANVKISSQALASVNFSTISPEAPNAYRIYVSHGDKSYEIFGDWASVKVHTFKRYLHQVYHIAPSAQILSVVKTGKVMDDDISVVKCFGIEEDSVVQLRSNIEVAASARGLCISLDDL
ncbi:hypothetical protein JKF63_05518 [Porcisia hertigi]|uniref:Ubiquitin-like domain-containing protein n=1 Tax=Porcisia hertigi TaxID=2761500 RepID=A0A836ILK0_9TRYP|nr:hypothetical protein JKF63_05518 [Porcisia hertigi]